MANRAFIRFRNITIPNASEVSNVFVRLTSYANSSGTPVNLRCAFVDADNPNAPEFEAELQAFSLTDWVNWTNLISWINGQVYDTPDLTNIMQVVINREGWVSGNSLILIIEDIDSSEQRGFSSIQFASGEEKAVLFATYVAREVNLVVDDGFSEALWTPTIANAGEITIEEDQVIISVPGSPTYARGVLETSWYSAFPIDAQISFDASNWTETDIFYLEFRVSYYNLPTQGYGTTCNLAFMRLALRPEADETDSNLSVYLNGDESEGKWESWVGRSRVLTLRMSCSSTGRVDFYVNGSLFHTAYFSNVEQYLGFIKYNYGKILFYAYSNGSDLPDGNNIAVWSNFNLLEGNPVFP